MEIIADSDALESLDPTVRRFIESAWEPPLTELSRAGLRRLKPDFPEKREIMAEAAAAMDQAFRYSPEEIVYDAHPSRNIFDRWRAQESGTLRAYRLLMEAWNQRRDLGVCRTCGNLLLPGKGRIARYCSDACRMRAYRSMFDAVRAAQPMELTEDLLRDLARLREEVDALEVVDRKSTGRRRGRVSFKKGK